MPRRAFRMDITKWVSRLTTPQWAPYAHENFVEAWIGLPVPGRGGRDSTDSDFWRASPEGRIYTIRGYAEDASDKRQPGAFFDVTLPVWRIAEGLLFARRLAEAYQDVDAIAIWCRFTGLNGRQLTSLDGSRAVLEMDVSRTDEIAMEAQVTPQQVDDNLAEVIHRLLMPLYERFSFFRLPMALVEQELARMVRGRF